MKMEIISMILTPLDKTFMLLCIMVYYRNNMNFILDEVDEIKCYVIKSDWQEAGILMYTNFHHRVLAHCAKNND